MATETAEWITVGRVGVDTARLIIIDPSYLTPDVVNEAQEAWSTMQAWPTVGPHGLGLLTSTGRGDGIYPVEVRLDERTLNVIELRIRFIEDNQT